MKKFNLFNTFQFAIFSVFFIFCFTTLSQAQTGPGGVGTNTADPFLQLWQKADAILPIPVDGTPTPFVDASGHGRTSTTGTQATYQSGQVNTFPVIRFNGTSMFYNDTYSYSARTVFTVYRASSVTQDAGDLAQLWGNYPQAHVAIDARATYNRGFSFDGSTTEKARYGLNGAVFSTFEEDINTQQWAYNQFYMASVEFQNTQAMTAQKISTLDPTTGHWFGGDLAEVIVYDRVLNPAERIVVENYLSSKYNIALSAIPVVKDFYAHDAANAQPFFHNVAGVGKLSATDVHVISASSLVEINGVNLTNNSYLFIGHNNASIASYSATNVPTGYERIGRTWRADVTGTIGQVTLRIDASQLPAGTACQLNIFTDGDNNFSSGATITPLVQQGASSIYQATLTIPNNTYFTIGRSIGASISLTASTLSAGSGEVDLSWTNPALADFVEYRIYGGLAANSTNLLATIPSQATLATTITGLTNCNLYYFRIVPVTIGNVESPCQGRATARPTDGLPPAQMNLTAATPVTFPSPNGQVTLTFDPSGDPNIRQIRVYRYASTDPPPTLPATPSSTFITGINATTTQVTVAGLFTAPPATPVITCYKITQVNQCGEESPLSIQQCATVTRQPEICNNSVDDDLDGNIDCGDPDCAGVAPCPGCIFQITDPGEFQLFQYKVIPICGTNTGYQTPIFGDVDNDNQTEIIMMGDNGCISVINPRIDGNPDIEHTQSNLIQASDKTSLLTMADVDNNGYIDFFYAIERTRGSTLNNPIVRYEYMYDDLGPNKFVLRWASDNPAINPIAAQRVSNTYRANTNLANFDTLGGPEVYCGGTIFDAITGQFLAYVGAGNPDGDPRDLGAGSPIFNVSNAADVLSRTDQIDTNGDGISDGICGSACDGLELLAGNVIYSVDFTKPIGSRLQIVRTAPTPTLPSTPTRSNTLPVDAVMSVADMDNDGDIDAVVSGYGKIYVWDIQDLNPVTTMLSNVFNLSAYGAGVTINGKAGIGDNSLFSGVPTINDFDKDGKNEFGVTKGRGVVMFNDIDTAALVNGKDLLPMWTLPTTDESGTTGLSSYDFLGTGYANLVYRDQTKVRIFQGLSGIVYFDSDSASFPACTSGTGMEVPTIGDVNDDGQTEIVASCDGRIIIYQSSNIPWLPSRDVWNQVNYNITNITGDLKIPTTIYPQNFQTIAPPLNDYLAQRPLSNSTTPFILAADIVAVVDTLGTSSGIDISNCPSDVKFNVDISNQGNADVTVQYPITFYSGDPRGSSWTKLSSFTITDDLLIGDQNQYSHSFALTNDPVQVYVVLNDAGTSTPGTSVILPNTSVAECEYENNFLGPYTVSSCFDPLPIQLIYFNGKDEGEKVRLNWATASERDNAYFEIQRSFNGQDFVTIDVIQGQKLSNQTLEYQTYDYENWTGTMYYRLKQVDTDGTPTLSNTIVFKRSNDLDINIYPNPISAGQDLHIEGLSGEWNAVLYDMAGRKIKNWSINFDRQKYTTPFPNLRKGMYILQLEPLTNKEQSKIIEKIIVE